MPMSAVKSFYSIKEAFSLSRYRPFPFETSLNISIADVLSPGSRPPLLQYKQLFKKFVTIILLKMYVDYHMKRQGYKMKVFDMFITAVCVVFKVVLRPKK